MLEHKCEICGKMSRNKFLADGKVVCHKHRTQFKKFGKFLDNNPRTQYDRNEIEIKGDIAYISLYNKNCEVVAKTMVDKEDLPLVQYIKWRISGSGYVINSSTRKRPNTFYLHRVVLGCDTTVDHINGDKFDNRKCNLRIANKSQNQMNVNYKGISQFGNRWQARIKLHQKALNIGMFIDKEEALYARWYAERILFKEFAYPKPEPEILESRKEEIKELVKSKVQRL